MALKPGITQFVVVQKGSLRGRRVALPPAIHGHRHFTSSLMKEAFFQLVEHPGGMAFFDLCAGSGQMALEALSRGFSPVHCVERDTARFQFLLKQLHGANIVFHNKDFRRLAPLIADTGGVAYLDVPYTFWTDEGVCPHIEEFLARLKSELRERGNPAPVVIAIQSPVPVHWANVEIKAWLETELTSQLREYRGHYLLMLKTG